MARYILLLPTKNRQSGNNSIHDTHSPLEINYFLAHGSHVSPKDYQEYQPSRYQPSRVSQPQLLDYLDIQFDGRLLQNVSQLSIV